MLGSYGHTAKLQEVEDMNPRKVHGRLAMLMAFALILAWMGAAYGYDKYRPGCNYCHPGFQDMGVTHALHVGSSQMTTTCTICHFNAGDIPKTHDSGEGHGCVGCHGVDNGSPGKWGAGLRKHHLEAGAPPDGNGLHCYDCHTDDPPTSPESTVPVYYLRSDVHIDDPCLVATPGGEDWDGDGKGLDNDGDLAYEADDSDCGGGGCYLNCPAGDGGLVSADGSGDRSPDFNGSGMVDVADFGYFASVYQTNEYCADFDCSGSVSLPDFAIFSSHYTHGPGPGGYCQ